MKSIILFGFFNSNNIGDRVISEIICRNLSSQFKVTCCSNEGDFVLYNKYVNEKLNLYEKIKHRICLCCGRLYKSPKYKAFIKTYKEALKHSSAIIFGGGNLLMDYSEKTLSFAKYNEYMTLANECGKKCYAISIGIGPFATAKQRKMAIRTLNKCRYVSFRDKSSYDLFINNGGEKKIAHISMDPVFTLPYVKKKVKTCDTIAVNIVNPYWYGSVYTGKVLNDYVRLIKQLSKKYPSMRIALFSTELNDMAGVKYVYSETCSRTNVFMERTEELDELKSLYDRSRVVIGTRMHSLIIAYSCKVPVVGLSWSEKVSSFFEIIDQPTRCIKLNDLGEKMGDVFRMIEDENVIWNFEHRVTKAKQLLLRDVKEIETNATD